MHVFVGLLRQDFGSEGYAIERAFKGRLGLLQKKKIEKTFSEREHKGLSAFSKMREAKGARFFAGSSRLCRSGGTKTRALVCQANIIFGTFKIPDLYRKLLDNNKIHGRP